MVDGAAAPDDGSHEVVFVGYAEGSMEGTEPGVVVVGEPARLRGRGDADADAALDEPGDGIDDFGEVLRCSHLVVDGRVGAVQGDLDGRPVARPGVASVPAGRG